MSNENNERGKINVSMRDNNTIGHIGHVFQKPPPAPNAVIQNGCEVGLAVGFSGETAEGAQLQYFHFVSSFDINSPFTLHGAPQVPLKIESFGHMMSISEMGVERQAYGSVKIRKV